MSDKILLIDDDANLLAASQRHLRRQFDVHVAQGGHQGLQIMASNGPFAVVVSDMRMPGMNGAEFLAQACQLAPDSVRILLTGYADMQTAVAAVNDGHIFRFLTKPCSPENFLKALEAGVHQYRLIRAEKELLSETLRGSINVLTEVLALVNPLAFGRASRVRRLVQQLANAVKAENVWQIEVAALLSQIGCVTVPEAVSEKSSRGESLTPAEQAMLEAHPRMGHDLVAHIPRLEDVAQIIALQEKHFDGRGSPPIDLSGSALPLGARLLKVALDFDNLQAEGRDDSAALAEMYNRMGWYDPQVLETLSRIVMKDLKFVSRFLHVRDLRCQMILDEDIVRMVDNLVLITKGQEITQALLFRLQHLSAERSIREPLLVLVPLV